MPASTTGARAGWSRARFDGLHISEGGIERVDYRDTDHYQVTRRFLEDPDRMLGYLLPHYE